MVSLCHKVSRFQIFYSLNKPILFCPVDCSVRVMDRVDIVCLGALAKRFPEISGWRLS